MFCSFHYSPQWKIIAKFVSRRLGLAPLPPRRSKFADLREKTGSGSSGFIQQLPLACSIHPSSPSKQQPRKHHHHPPPARIQQFIYLLGFFPETPCWLHLAAKLGWNSGLIVILSRGGFAVSASGATLAHQQRSLQHKTQRTLRPRDQARYAAVRQLACFSSCKRVSEMLFLRVSNWFWCYLVIYPHHL